MRMLPLNSGRIALSLRVTARLALVASMLLGAAIHSTPVRAQSDSAADELPQQVRELLDAQPLPAIVVDPQRRYAVLVHRRRLLQLSQLAEPAVELAGRRIDIATAAAHAPLNYYGLTLVDLLSGRRVALSVPRDAILGYPQWAADGSRFSFTVSRASGTELWIGDPHLGFARRLVRNVKASHGAPCSWTADARALICEMAADADADAGARAQAGSGLTLPEFRPDAGERAGEPVLLSPQLSRRLLEAQLTKIDVGTGAQRPLGRPAAFESVSMSPGGVFVLVRRITRPYPRVSGVDTPGRITEVWDIRGNVLMQLPETARAVQWHSARASTLTWVERSAGLDRVHSLSAPFAGSAEPVFELNHAFSAMRFIGGSDAMLVSEYDRTSGSVQVWHVPFGDAALRATQILTYPSGSAQSPVTIADGRGTGLVAQDAGDIFWRGLRNDGDTQREYLQRISLASGEVGEVWTANGAGSERLVDVVTPDARFVLVNRSSRLQPPGYYLLDQKTGEETAIGRPDERASPIAGAPVLPLRYRRDDGLELDAMLYLPPDYDGSKPLPAILWAYPHTQRQDDDTARFARLGAYPSFERTFRLMFLLQGFAVLDDVAMPIVGSDDNANDSFVEQVVANAQAVVAAAAQTGYVDPNRVGVAGRSYGAFMTANLLAHSNLFAAGAALSGAYNRTLTPFGFQTERRTLWEAPETYLAMSPILFSHQIEAPLLLVHGLDDDNAGTSPMQSTLLYSAITGNGGDAELLLLPWEGHAYRARESVHTAAARMLGWFESKLAPTRENPSDENSPDEDWPDEETGAMLRPLE